MVGLAVTQSINQIGMAQVAMKTWSDLDARMTAVQRVLEYAELPPEEDKGNFVPSESWPQEGNIEFKSVTMRYSPEKTVVLKQICFTVKSGEKLGIVGRTGAGKTSLISVLFRLFPQRVPYLLIGLIPNQYFSKLFVRRSPSFLKIQYCLLESCARTWTLLVSSLTFKSGKLWKTSR
jgi:ABC-type bacteriocin/lantibiotic exporter with double-glycine peptidase domain